MSIYKLQSDFENYLSFNLDIVVLAKKNPFFRPRKSGIPLASNWNIPEGSFFASENCKNPEMPDITMWGPGYLVLGQRAHETLSNALKRSGELLPISINGKTFYMLNALFMLPEEAMDKSKAVEAIELGVHIGTVNVKIDESKLLGYLVFKSDLDKKVGLYCTDTLLEACSKNDLQGLSYEKL